MTFTNRMSFLYLGFVLLIWFPCVSGADGTALPCPAPSLEGGYLVPDEDNYPHGKTLFYGCSEGLKPAVEGWWEQITCQNGQWSQTPQCIDKKSCLPPTVPHGNPPEISKAWYRKNQSVKIKCHDGYQLVNQFTRAKCVDGEWTSLPACEKSPDACNAPSKIPNAVIIHQYQEVFAAGAEVQYKCKDGYTTEEADAKKSITCVSGKWKEGPACSPETSTQSGDSGKGPSQGDLTDVKPVVEIIASAVTETQAAGGVVTPTGTPSSSGSKAIDSPAIVPISVCGDIPTVTNGVLSEVSTMHLNYVCNPIYTQVGQSTVVCYGDKTWSQLPVCNDTSCFLDHGLISSLGLKTPSSLYLKDRDMKTFECAQNGYVRVLRCNNRIIEYNACCYTSIYGRTQCL